MHRLLLTNDDGIDAPGLMALASAAEGLGELRIVAPREQHSGGSHVVSTHRPVAARPRGDGAISVDGTPADCVRLGLHHLFPGADCVLSGINHGGNLGVDVYHSGTVAAAREAVINGRSGIAISQYLARDRPVDWGLARKWTRRVLLDLIAQTWTLGSFWNVNLPHPLPGAREPRIVFCPLDHSPLPLDYRVEGEFATYSGNYQARARKLGCDVSVCFDGDIAVTRIPL